MSSPKLRPEIGYAGFTSKVSDSLKAHLTSEFVFGLQLFHADLIEKFFNCSAAVYAYLMCAYVHNATKRKQRSWALLCDVPSWLA